MSISIKPTFSDRHFDKYEDSFLLTTNPELNIPEDEFMGEFNHLYLINNGPQKGYTVRCVDYYTFNTIDGWDSGELTLLDKKFETLWEAELFMVERIMVNSPKGWLPINLNN